MTEIQPNCQYMYVRMHNNLRPGGFEMHIRIKDSI